MLVQTKLELVYKGYILVFQHQENATGATMIENYNCIVQMLSRVADSASRYSIANSPEIRKPHTHCAKSLQ
jgi:hypothetical protein